MAAFTTFSEQALRRYLIMFRKGELSAFEPITGGIENSNYFITLDEDTECVLTIIEGLDFNEVPFFNKIVSRLFQYGLPVAAPHTTLDGMSSTIFCGKPTFLTPKLAGTHPVNIEPHHCRAIGDFLARSHAALADMPITRKNPYDISWMRLALDQVRSQLSGEDSILIKSLIEQYQALNELDLPRGLVHGDLFKDNALFENDTLTGVIDYFHACEDLLIQDIAIAINDWTIRDDLTIEPALGDALLAGYEETRTLSATEKDALPSLQRVSAARFALTRLQSGDPPLKDPQSMLTLARSLGNNG